MEKKDGANVDDYLDQAIEAGAADIFLLHNHPPLSLKEECSRGDDPSVIFNHIANVLQNVDDYLDQAIEAGAADITTDDKGRLVILTDPSETVPRP
jgi:transcriptional/translational regulatory protein YebC/TACO1